MNSDCWLEYETEWLLESSTVRSRHWRARSARARNYKAQTRDLASNGAEMGVFNSLQVDRREANIMRMLPDYLPLGQNLGIFNVT